MRNYIHVDLLWNQMIDGLFFYYVGVCVGGGVTGTTDTSDSY